MNEEARWSRRRVLKVLSSGGAGSAVFARALTALVQNEAPITEEMIRQAEWIAGVSYTPEDRELMRSGIEELQGNFEALRAIELDNSVAPALHFEVLAARTEGARRENDVRLAGSWTATRPGTDEELAFAPVRELAKLVRSRRVSSEELTRLYLGRLRHYDPLLECVVSYTEDLALEQARRADREISLGRYRGPLHGIPWGAKAYESQVREDKATVVARLEEAGAVLIAKLSLGALAWGDVWFGGKTKNPWNPSKGSSGSSAGSAAATAAGLVGFAIGTETLGSIVSPSTRCGVTGLRPTFGRVSRYGAMALSWSMDKIGPMARSVEDCALIFGAIHGADGLDPTALDRPFQWPLPKDPRALRMGYVPELFERDRAAEAEDERERRDLKEWQRFDQRTLETLESIGFELVPIQLPKRYPVEDMTFLLDTEAAAAFDELTRSGRDDLLVRQIERAWPNVFRQQQLTPAVEYLRANRIRTLLMQEMEEALRSVDVYVTPSYVGGNLPLTNLTGHPSVVVPNGFTSSDGTPTSITFTGTLFGETAALAAAHAYQEATDFHLARPPIEQFLKRRSA